MSTLFTAARLPFSVAVGTAVGGAVSGALTPGVQGLINEANARFPLKPPSYFMLAEGVAKGRVDPGWARDRAAEGGISPDAFDKLTHIAQIGPGLDVAYQLWRRKLIDPAGFARAVKEEAIDDAWLDALEQLHDVLLSPAELANARQQEFIGDDRLHSEGELQGYSAERMDLLFKMAGLPPGPMEGLDMLRRGIIDETVFRAIVAEGHTKTKYTDDLLALRDKIVSAHEWAGLWLRGHATQAEAEAGAAKDGFNAEALKWLYLNRGRPATVRQVHLGYARGAKHPGSANELEAITAAVHQSDIRDEWLDIEEAARWTYPSAFVIRALTQDGTFTQDVSRQILVESGWKPEWADAASAAWAAATLKGTTQKWTGRAASRLFTTAHNEYMAGRISATKARSILQSLGAAPNERDAVLALWDLEAPIQTRDLTQAQIIKLWKKGQIDDAGALARLEYHGLTVDDATKLLDANR